MASANGFNNGVNRPNNMAKENGNGYQRKKIYRQRIISEENENGVIISAAMANG